MKRVSVTFTIQDDGTVDSEFHPIEGMCSNPAIDKALMAIAWGAGKIETTAFRLSRAVA
ncbi:MAG: hypothetical protein PHN84_09060 [Desulfuromonadaceae bacterium]|nr:hypothetical protein [Desulfuromonadaceae bacterium]MDD2856906.1 hypothetical protein [Desulfuromonadaceae bacterium]